MPLVDRDTLDAEDFEEKMLRQEPASTTAPAFDDDEEAMSANVEVVTDAQVVGSDAGQGRHGRIPGPRVKSAHKLVLRPMLITTTRCHFTR